MLVTYTMDEIMHMKTMTAEEIDIASKLPITYDEDCPMLTDEQLAQFHRVNKKTA